MSTTLPKSSPAFAAHVVHIEGLDLAGKSTATQALLDRHPGSELRRNALTEGNRPFLLADELRRGAGTSAETLGQLYVAALRRDIATYEPPSTETVQDSTILLRSLAFNTVIGATNIADELWDLLPYHPRFRTSIVLTASIEVRLDRLKQRYRDEIRFEIERVVVRFYRNTRFDRLILARWERLLNYSTRWLEFHEYRLAWLFPLREVEFHLRRPGNSTLP